MDSEEKEFLKKILSKIENLEREVEKIKKEREIPSPQKIQRSLNLPPLPKVKDKLARAIVKKAREKLIRQAVGEEIPAPISRKTTEDKVEEIRRNFDLGEVVLFALKRNLIKRAKGPAKET